MGLFILTDSNVLAQSEDLVNMVFERDMALDVDASDIETDLMEE